MAIMEPLRHTEQNTFGFLKFIIFVKLKRKNDFRGYDASYKDRYLGLLISE